MMQFSQFKQNCISNLNNRMTPPVTRNWNLNVHFNPVQSMDTESSDFEQTPIIIWNGFCHIFDQSGSSNIEDVKIWSTKGNRRH